MGNFYSYNPTVQDNSGELIGAGIQKGIGALGAGILQGINKRDESKAADAEFDILKQMYPEMAQFDDKFHDANLKGKQGILSQGKAFAMKNAEERDRDARAAAATKMTEVKTKDGATLYINGLGTIAHVDRPEKVVPPVTYRDIEGTDYVGAYQGERQVATVPKSKPQSETPPVTYQDIPGTNYVGAMQGNRQVATIPKPPVTGADVPRKPVGPASAGALREETDQFGNKTYWRLDPATGLLVEVKKAVPYRHRTSSRPSLPDLPTAPPPPHNLGTSQSRENYGGGPMGKYYPPQ